MAGHPALELCNTRAGWGERTASEYLLSYQHLVLLARDQGVLPPDVAARLGPASAHEPRRADDVLRRARRLRGDLYAFLIADPTPAAVRRLDSHVRAAASQRHLRGRRAGRACWEFGGALLEQPLLGFGWAAYTLLDGAAMAGVAACPGAGCGWLFLDPSRRRRWCSMRWCGNRAKVARHAQRARQGWGE